MMAFLLACTGANEPPRFESYNGLKVKYLFGFAYPDGELGEELIVSAGERFDISIDVSDADGDEIELLFPQAPLGWSFEANSRKGYWMVPETYWSDHITLQVLAVDENGGASAMFLTYYLNDVVLPPLGIEGLFFKGGMLSTNLNKDLSLSLLVLLPKLVSKNRET